MFSRIPLQPQCAHWGSFSPGEALAASPLEIVNNHLPFYWFLCDFLDGGGEGFTGGSAGRLGAGEQAAAEVSFGGGRVKFA